MTHDMAFNPPPPLASGSRVVVVAPAGPVTRADVMPRVQSGLEVLREWGFDVVEAPHLWSGHPELPYLAANDGDRAADFTAAWTDPDVAAVWCARGGYGVQRMIERLELGVLAAGSGTWLVGFSDITSLLHRASAATQQWSVHGPVVSSLGDRDPVALEHVRTLVTGAGQPTLLDGLLPWHDVSTPIDGHLIGGNVSLLASSISTGDLLDPRAAVVFLEDVSEAAYVLDRGLTQLIRSGWLTQASAIILGDFSMSSPAAETEAMLRDRLGDIGVPVWSRGEFGHVAVNRALPLGARVSLSEGQLTFA